MQQLLDMVAASRNRHRTESWCMALDVSFCTVRRVLQNTFTVHTVSLQPNNLLSLVPTILLCIILYEQWHPRARSQHSANELLRAVVSPSSP
jgi:hypothetical protein